MPGCHGKSINIRRHLSHCHRHLTEADRDNVLLKYKRFMTASAEDARKNIHKYPLRQCSVCDKQVRRLDIHLEKIHLLKRRSVMHRRVLA